MILWVYGQTGSGKSTVIEKVRESVNIAHLNSETLKDLIARDCGYGRRGRQEKYNRLIVLAEALNAVGVDAIVETISPFEDQRTELALNHNVIMVRIKCYDEECRRRDPKGLWVKAKKENWDMPFEPPTDITEDIVIDTGILSAKDAANILIDIIKR